MSVIVLAREGGRTLERALGAIAAQVHVSPEVLVVDGGLSAREAAKLSFRARAAGGRLMGRGPQGVAQALAKAGGSYLAPLSDADAWLPAFLSVMVSRLEAAGRPFALAGASHEDRGPAQPEAYGLAAALGRALSRPARLGLPSRLVCRREAAASALVGPPWASPESHASRFVARGAQAGLSVPERLVDIGARPGQAGLVREAADLAREVLGRLSNEELKPFLSGLLRLDIGPVDPVDALCSGAERLWNGGAFERSLAALLVEQAFERSPERAVAWSGDRHPLAGWESMEDAGRELALQAAAGTQDDALEGERALEPANRPQLRLAKSAGGRPPYTVGRMVRLELPEAGPFLVAGFSEQEAWGRWTDGFIARLAMRLGGLRRDLELELWPAMTIEAPGRPCRLRISVNGEPALVHDVAPGVVLRHPIPREALGWSGALDIRLDVLHPKTTSQEPREETRRLGVGVAAFRIAPPDSAATP